MPIAEVGSDAHGVVPVGLPELDRVLGGGLVPGSVTLLGGEPGVGKSTLLLQAAAALAAGGRRVLYLTAEESPEQVRRRAERLGALRPKLLVAATGDLPGLLGQVDHARPEVLVVDSIQTVHDPDVASAPGSVAQVRQCASALVEVVNWSDSALKTMKVYGKVTSKPPSSKSEHCRESAGSGSTRTIQLSSAPALGSPPQAPGSRDSVGSPSRRSSR